MKHVHFGIALLGSLLLQTGCAAGVEVRPTGPIGSQARPLERNEAVALGQRWCAQNGWRCELDDVDLVQGQTVWLVEFEARRTYMVHDDHGHDDHGHGKGKGKGHYKARGKGHLKHGDEVREERTDLKFAIDAWSGEMLDVDRS